MLTEQDMTIKLLKQLIKEKKQELEKITKNDPRIIEITNDINDFKQTLSKYNEDPLAALLYQKIINMKKESLQRLTTNHYEIIKLKTEITALETTLHTITKIKEQPEKTVEKEVTIQPKPFATNKATPLLPKPVPVHPLDRASVNQKIELFNKQGTGLTIKKDYKNCNLSLWGEKGNLISFSQYNRNIDDSAIEELDTWLDKTVKYSGYYNKLKKIFKKTNKDFLISSVFDKQCDRIYINYCHQSKDTNVTSVFHIKKKGKSYIESTKEVNDCTQQFELKLKNNTTLNISSIATSSNENEQMKITLKHLEQNVNPNNLNTHFEKIFKAFDKQNHLK